MLESLRRGAQTWVAKFLFAILVFSFGIWGVADVFTGYGRGAVATVGKTEVPVEDFQRAYQNELERFSEGSERRLTAEQGRALGLDQRVLNQLLGGAAMEQHAETMGMRLSDKTLADGVQTDPNFQGADGKFSKAGFESVLRQLGLSEKGFFNLRRKDEIKRQMIGAFVEGQTVPKPLIDAMHAYKQEKRVIEWVAIDSAKAVDPKEPDDVKLKELYDKDAAERYMTPEYRKFEVLLLTPNELKGNVTVSDEDIAKAYEATKDSYDTPEQRRIQQIAFKDKAGADAALKALRDGSKTFADVAKDAGAKDSDVDLGLIAKKGLIDPKIADVAFALEKDKFSDVAEGTFATVILRVTQIVPGVTKTLADVKDEVRDKIAIERAKSDVKAKYDEVENARAEGKALKDIAATLKLTYKEIAASDRNGLGPDKKPALDSPDAAKLAGHVFASDDTSGGDHVEISDDGHAWVNLLSTEAPKQRTFEDVKDQVKGAYMVAETARLVNELAKTLADRVNAGEPMSAIAKDAGGTVAKTEPVTRVTLPQGLSEQVVAQAFVLAKGRAGHATTTNRDSEIVFRIDDVIAAPEATKEQVTALTAELSSDLVNQALGEYTEALKAKIGTSVNMTELRRALGTSEQ